MAMVSTMPTTPVPAFQSVQTVVTVPSQPRAATVQARSAAASFALSGVSAAAAVVLSNPFEVVKTRFQLQGELTKSGEKLYTSLGSAFVRMVREEGVAAVQKGLGLSIIYQTLFNGIRIGLFDHAKSILHSDSAPTASRLAAGASTGCLAAAVCSPIYLVKCRFQAQISGTSAAQVTTQHNYQSSSQAFKSIYAQGGLRGLYRGVDGFVLRTAVGSAFQLSAFDIFKGPCQDLFGSWTGTIVGAGLSGLVATTAMNPFDVVSTRLYNQQRLPDGSGALYSNPIDCMVKSVRAEGPSVFMKGFTSHALRLGPHTVYCLVFFEKMKAVADLFGY